MAGPDAGTSTRATDRRGLDAGSRGTDAHGLPGPASGEASTPVKTPVVAAGPAIGVWAFRVGDFERNPGAGWTHAFKIKSLQDLLEELRDAELQGKVSQLAIVAHGDTGGLVQLDRDMTEKNVASFGKELAQLADYLTPDGKLMFMSCVAGAGKEGTQLLGALSTYLRGRSIIGFIVNGTIRARGLAGDVFEGARGSTGMDPRLFKGEPRMTEDSQYAKWVRDKRLVRLPLGEEFSSLKDSWTVITATTNAKPAGQLKAATVKIATDTIELTKGNKRVWLGALKLDLTKKPRTIDINFTAAKKAAKQATKEKERISLGILRFGEEDFDALTICLAEPGKARPDDFTSPEKSGRTLLDLQRAPAPSKKP
jgi:uncharacterized protein (TIGR03067 family)